MLFPDEKNKTQCLTNFPFLCCHTTLAMSVGHHSKQCLMATRAVSITNNLTNFSRLWHGLEQTATLSKPIQNGIVSQIKQAFVFQDFGIICNITATQQFGQVKSLENIIK
jgi:hypothetical protein